jgi:hypothetical protein
MTNSERLNGARYEVGYCKPPEHRRFQPGRSGNPSGRPKGSPNLKTLFQKILKEQISLREGNVTKKISKAEAVMRGLVIGALKGDPRSVMTLLRIAEQTGEFEEAGKHNHEFFVRWMTDADNECPNRESVPAICELNRE